VWKNQVILHEDENITIIPLLLHYEKEIYIIYAYEQDGDNKYLLNMLIAVNQHIITCRLVDTIAFFDELAAFDYGSNEHNRFFKIVLDRDDNKLDLKLSYGLGEELLLNKIEAKLMVETFKALIQEFPKTALSQGIEKSIEKTIKTFRDNLLGRAY